MTLQSRLLLRPDVKPGLPFAYDFCSSRLIITFFGHFIKVLYKVLLCSSKFNKTDCKGLTPYTLCDIIIVIIIIIIIIVELKFGCSVEIGVVVWGRVRAALSQASSLPLLSSILVKFSSYYYLFQHF